MARLRYIAPVLMLTLVPCMQAHAQDAAALRASGVAAAREGRLEEGRRLLEAALAASPGDRQSLADLLVVLSWAGQDRAALARLDALGEAAAPGYALAAAALAARRTGQATRAVRLYRAALERGENGVEVHLGLALAEAGAEAGLSDGVAARAALAAAERAHPGHPRIAAVARDVERLLQPDPAATAARLRTTAQEGGPDAAIAAARGQGAGVAAALADALVDLGHPFDALRVLEAALAAHPRDRALRRREALVLAALGAPDLALARSAALPGLLAPAEERRIAGASMAFRVRWGAQVGTATPRDPAARHARTDAAIAALDSAILAWTALGPQAAGAVRTARLDRVVALRDRGRMAEALAEAEELRAQAPLPSYVREAAADALLHLRRPAEAEAEYRGALEADPAALMPSLGLFYALSEQRRWREARAVADRLERDTPAYRPVRGPEPPVENWDRLEAAGAGILWRMWGDDLAGAEALAGPLAEQAPMNASLRALRGDIWRMRGWTEQALEEYETALTNAPDALDLRLGRAEALLVRRRWRDARAEIATLAAEYAENAAVRRLVRRQALRDMREVEAVVLGGLPRGGSDPELDVAVRLYSAPIDEAWRVFGGARLRTGETPSGALTTYRALAGVEWSGPAALVRAGVTLDREGVDRGGAFLETALRLSDRWVLEGNAEMSAADTPLQALRNNVHADAAGAGLAWRQSDLREAGASVRVMRFSDDNTRLIGFARWQERVLNLPDWKGDLQPYVYATANSREGVPYYNPERDIEAGVTAALTWIAWKRYEPELRVRLVVTAGGYWQEGFGWSPMGALRWENQHVVSDTFSFAYGAGWIHRSYDGVAENSLSVSGALRWRF